MPACISSGLVPHGKESRAFRKLLNFAVSEVTIQKNNKYFSPSAATPSLKLSKPLCVTLYTSFKTVSCILVKCRFCLNLCHYCRLFHQKSNLKFNCSASNIPSVQQSCSNIGCSNSKVSHFFFLCFSQL